MAMLGWGPVIGCISHPKNPYFPLFSTIFPFFFIDVWVKIILYIVKLKEITASNVVSLTFVSINYVWFYNAFNFSLSWISSERPWTLVWNRVGKSLLDILTSSSYQTEWYQLRLLMMGFLGSLVFLQDGLNTSSVVFKIFKLAEVFTEKTSPISTTSLVFAVHEMVFWDEGLCYIVKGSL